MLTARKQARLVRRTGAGGELTMCMNCACGQPEERHKPGDITLSQLKEAARNHDMDVDTAVDNITNAAIELKQAGRI
jgi:hypothetical protein